MKRFLGNILFSAALAVALTAPAVAADAKADAKAAAKAAADQLYLQGLAASEPQYDALAAKIKAGRPLKFLFLGDSLTDFDRGRNHIDIVNYYLKKHDCNVEFFNYACGGDTIEIILDRLYGRDRGRHKKRFEGMFDRKYDAAFIFLGHNDSKANSAYDFKVPVITPEMQHPLYRDVIAFLKEKGIPSFVLFSSTSSNFAVILPVSEQRVRDKVRHNRFGIPEHMERYNAELKKIAEANGFGWCDLYAPTRDYPDKAALFRPDGVHLSTKGYELVALKMLQYLAGLDLAKFQ